MNAITKVDGQKLMLLEFMADKYGLKPQEFADTVRKTCGLATASAEEFAAFVMVAREYDLNPLLREIYAFPKRGGGIVPIVSIDGWVNLVNSHPACDGFEFDVDHGEKGDLISITCRMYRKDRNRPVVVTEYYDECKRDTEPWKMKHRMLRHKAMIQAARYAFGFSGIYDEDEGAKIAEMRDITPSAKPTPPKPPAPPVSKPVETIEVITADGEIVHGVQEATTDSVADSIDADGEEIVDDNMVDDTTFFERLDEALAVASDAASIEEVWTEFDPLARFAGKPNGETNQAIALQLKKRAEKRIGGGNVQA